MTQTVAERRVQMLFTSHRPYRDQTAPVTTAWLKETLTCLAPGKGVVSLDNATPKKSLDVCKIVEFLYTKKNVLQSLQPLPANNKSRRTIRGTESGQIHRMCDHAAQTLA